MRPVLYCSSGNANVVPRTSSIPRQNNQFTRSISGKCSTPLSYFPKGCSLPKSHIQLYSVCRKSCGRKVGLLILAAVGSDLSIEEPNPASSIVFTNNISVNLGSVGTDESIPSRTVVNNKSAKNFRIRSVRRSESPRIKNEELIPGASFTGKVRSIQPFGAFVDFGAFTDGLVHVSRMSSGYVKDVGAVVSVGQEVKVKIVEVNIESGRISLSMHDKDNTSITHQRKTGENGSAKPRPTPKNGPRGVEKDGTQKSSKFVKGQVLDGIVKNITRSGAFLSLPEGEEGFLSISEESEGLGSVLGNSSLEVGQEVTVRVLRISRGRVTLAMKKEIDVESLNMKLNQGVSYAATNPFELAFRSNKDISAFLLERKTSRRNDTISKAGPELSGERINETATDLGSSLGFISENEYGSVHHTISEDLFCENNDVGSVSIEKDTDLPVSSLYVEEVTSLPVGSVSIGEISEVEKGSDESINSNFDEASRLEGRSPSASNTTESTADISDIPKIIDFSASLPTEAASVLSLGSDPLKDSLLSERLNSSSETDFVNEQIRSSDSSILVGKEFRKASIDHESSTDIIKDVDSAAENFVQEIESGQFSAALFDDNNKSYKKVTISVDINDQIHDSAAESNIKGISSTLVKQLRDETGAGMMDCKKALAESGGDLVKAQEYLRHKGLAGAEKKASRVTEEGRVGSYVHDNRIGILIEVNCETDFVSRGEIFKLLVDDLAMQAAACPEVQYVVPDDVPQEIIDKEREIEKHREDLSDKPEEIRSKIVDGRVKKRLGEMALLEQPYIKNDKVLVKDWLKQTIATVGENIKVKRFVRFNLGEGLERKKQDFAAEVAAQTVVKSYSPPVSVDVPSGASEEVQRSPTIVISSGLVKQLREETGAGMMDCKKALSESGGDLEKAQEYLRRKGLSTAEKKSSRLAVEGRIASYVHDSRIGALIEVNCETDFVGRSRKFQELVDDLAMQVVACPQVQFVSVEDIPESVLAKEKEIELLREDLQSRPENARQMIVEGRIAKRAGELALLEQPFIKDNTIKVKDLLKQSVVAVGENINVRRFARFTLGQE